MSRPNCPVCWRRWGKELWSKSCVCTGHVTPSCYPTAHLPEPTKPQAPAEQKLKSWTDIKIATRYK